MTDWAQEGADLYQEREEERESMAHEAKIARARNNVKLWESRAKERRGSGRERAIKNADRWVTIWLRLRR